MSDYQSDLDRFMDAWEQVQRQMREKEQLQRLADRQGTTVAQLESKLDTIDRELRQLAGPYRPTRSELVNHALKHGPQSD